MHLYNAIDKLTEKDAKELVKGLFAMYVLAEALYPELGQQILDSSNTTFEGSAEVRFVLKWLEEYKKTIPGLRADGIVYPGTMTNMVYNRDGSIKKETP